MKLNAIKCENVSVITLIRMRIYTFGVKIRLIKLDKHSPIFIIIVISVILFTVNIHIKKFIG